MRRPLVGPQTLGRWTLVHQMQTDYSHNYVYQIPCGQAVQGGSAARSTPHPPAQVVSWHHVVRKMRILHE